MTLVMALGFGLVLMFTSIALPPDVRADGRYVVDIADPTGGGDTGDPDIPTGPNRGSNHGAQSGTGSLLDISAAGDGGRKSIVMWRLQIALQVLGITIRR